MKISQYLLYERDTPSVINTKEGTVQKVYKFPNGYGASVIKGPGTYGYDQGLWELAVLEFRGEEKWYIVYNTTIADDVIGSLNKEEIKEILQKIYELSEPLDHILGLRKKEV